MPFEDFTMPSSLSVLTCRPALPGGRFFVPAFCWRAIRDSNGSRREYLPSESDESALPSAAGAAAGAADVGFALGLAKDCFEPAAALVPTGAVWARKHEALAASKIAITRVFTERIVRSFRSRSRRSIRLRSRCCWSRAAISWLGKECRRRKCTGD